MSITIKTITLLLFVFTASTTFSQTNIDRALTKAQRAVVLMDSGKIDQSILLLTEAIILDPSRFDYTYELAYAQYLNTDYKKVITLLRTQTNHQEANERLFQLLGNAYDEIGDTAMAFKTYNKGLDKFPYSGMMYLEKGNVHWNNGAYEKALSFYERGIELAPKFASNYYRATLLYCTSTEEIWGMIYGEIFINLEQDTQRTAEISKLLYDTYKSEIKLTSATSFSVSFCKNEAIDVDINTPQKDIKLPFGVGIYEPTLLMSLFHETSIDLNSLDRIRTNFIKTYYQSGHQKKYRNILFDYHNLLLKAGHLEAYNHWVLMHGDKEAFDKWYGLNKKKWNDYLKWSSLNKLNIDENHKFVSYQYY